MKIGSIAVAPWSARSSKNCRVKSACALQGIVVFVSVVADTRTTQGVARCVAPEGRLVLREIFKGLAECEIEVETVGVGEILARELVFHRRELGGREAESLEVGEAPVRLAQPRFEGNRATIRGDALFLLPGALERVTVAQPDARLMGVLCQYAGKEFDRPAKITSAGEDGCLEIAIAGIARLVREQSVYLCECGAGLALAQQDDGVVVARGSEARREFEATLEEQLRIAVATEPGTDLREHANRGDIGRMLQQVLPQARLGYGKAAVAQRGCRLEQARIACRVANMARVGSVCARDIAHQHQVVAEQAPGIRKVRLELYGAAQGCNGRLAAARGAQGKPEFEMRRRRVGLGACKRLENAERRGDVAHEAASAGQRQ